MYSCVMALVLVTWYCIPYTCRQVAATTEINFNPTATNRFRKTGHLVTFNRPWVSVKFTGKVPLGLSNAKLTRILCGRRW